MLLDFVRWNVVIRYLLMRNLICVCIKAAPQSKNPVT